VPLFFPTTLDSVPKTVVLALSSANLTDETVAGGLGGSGGGATGDLSG